jgi:ABC-type transport system involved in Fe-S cluster assembly fused permease/ATPase subunit
MKSRIHSELLDIGIIVVIAIMLLDMKFSDIIVFVISLCNFLYISFEVVTSSYQNNKS